MAEGNDDLPYMGIFVRDILADLADLDDAERGATLSLMFACWAEGGAIDGDPKRLARRAGTDAEHWPARWRVIARFFVVVGARVANPTVTAELARAREQREARRRGAAETNRQRAQRDGQRSAQRAQSDTPSIRRAARSKVGNPDPSPSPSPSGSAPPSPPSKPEGPPGGAPTGARPLIARFCERWKEKHGERYLVLPKDAGAVEKLLKVHPLDLETWDGMIERYLNDPSYFHAERQHPLEALANNPNAFRGIRTGGRLSRAERSEQTVRNLLAWEAPENRHVAEARRDAIDVEARVVCQPPAEPEPAPHSAPPPEASGHSPPPKPPTPEEFDELRRERQAKAGGSA